MKFHKKKQSRKVNYTNRFQLYGCKRKKNNSALTDSDRIASRRNLWMEIESYAIGSNSKEWERIGYVCLFKVRSSLSSAKKKDWRPFFLQWFFFCHYLKSIARIPSNGLLDFVYISFFLSFIEISFSLLCHEIWTAIDFFFLLYLYLLKWCSESESVSDTSLELAMDLVNKKKNILKKFNAW